MNPQLRACAALVVATLILSVMLYVPVSAQGLTTSRRAAPSPIYIGQVIPLTGPRAGVGVYLQAAAQLALDQINAQGGINGRLLQLVLADDQSTPGGGIAAFQRLVGSDHGVSAILGPNFSKEILPMLPYIRREGIPIIIGGTAPILTQVGNPWIFRTRPNSFSEAKVLATFVGKTLHLTKIALLHADDTGSAAENAAMSADLQALGLTPVTDQSFTNGASDMTGQLKAIKAAGATAIISVNTFPLDSLTTGRQMQQLGLHLTLVGSPNFAGPDEYPSPFLYGTYAVTDYVANQSPEAVAFDAGMKAQFHLAGGSVAYAYDGLKMLVLVMRQVGIDPRAVRQGLLAIKGYHGAEGTYTFDRSGDGLHQDTIVQNVQGHLRIVKVVTF